MTKHILHSLMTMNILDQAGSDKHRHRLLCYRAHVKVGVGRAETVAEIITEHEQVKCGCSSQEGVVREPQPVTTYQTNGQLSSARRFAAR